MNSRIPEFQVTGDDQQILLESLDYLTANPIEGVDPRKYFELKLQAFSIEKRLKNHSDDLSLNDLRTMYIALLNLRVDAIEMSYEMKHNQQIGKRLLISKIDSLTLRIKNTCQQLGFDVDQE